jgi:hypothetical protein
LESAPPHAPTPAEKRPRRWNWLYVSLAILAAAAGICSIVISLISSPFDHDSGRLFFFGGFALGWALILLSARLLDAGLERRKAPPALTREADGRATIPAPSEERAPVQRKGLAVSNPVTLFREVTEAPDRIIFSPKAYPWIWALIIFFGIAFAGGGAFSLAHTAAHTPEKQAAQRARLPPGARLPNADSELSDWAFGLGFIAIGGLMFIGGLCSALTFRSVVVNPEKRELVRKIALRWPTWTFTRSWQASDIDSVYLDEYVTVWPGTPELLQFIGRVEPSETSEGHVWIRLRTGMAVDFGKGAWEEAVVLAGRLAGLLGTPKTLRARYEVGPPPSNDTSSHA